MRSKAEIEAAFDRAVTLREDAEEHGGTQFPAMSMEETLHDVLGWVLDMFDDDLTKV